MVIVQMLVQTNKDCAASTKIKSGIETKRGMNRSIGRKKGKIASLKV